MAQAKQCNRCDRLYKPYRQQINVLGIRGSYNGVTMADISADGSSFSRSGLLDLCPECMESLIGWLKDGKPENTIK